MSWKKKKYLNQRGSLQGQYLRASCLLTQVLGRYFRASPFLEHFCHTSGEVHLPANLPDGSSDTDSSPWSLLCFYLGHRSFFLLVAVTLFEKFDNPQMCQLWTAKVSLTQSPFFFLPQTHLSALKLPFLSLLSPTPLNPHLGGPLLFSWLS